MFEVDYFRYRCSNCKTVVEEEQLDRMNREVVWAITDIGEPLPWGFLIQAEFLAYTPPPPTDPLKEWRDTMSRKIDEDILGKIYNGLRDDIPPPPDPFGGWFAR